LVILVILVIVSVWACTDVVFCVQNFDNAILTNARFGKGKNGEWAQLDGVNWDGALLSSSDAQRVCENPTVDDYGKAILGCK